MVDYDDTGSIGKRYRREDEIGTPFCITVDFDTVGDEAKGCLLYTSILANNTLGIAVGMACNICSFNLAELCATQYASAWMTADIYRDGYHYHLDFKKGENLSLIHI